MNSKTLGLITAKDDHTNAFFCKYCSTSNGDSIPCDREDIDSLKDDKLCLLERIQWVSAGGGSHTFKDVPWLYVGSLTEETEICCRLLNNPVRFLALFLLSLFKGVF